MSIYRKDMSINKNVLKCCWSNLKTSKKTYTFVTLTKNWQTIMRLLKPHWVWFVRHQFNRNMHWNDFFYFFHPLNTVAGQGFALTGAKLCRRGGVGGGVGVKIIKIYIHSKQLTVLVVSILSMFWAHSDKRLFY